MFGVYRVLKNGTHRYVSRTVTDNERLAQAIAADLTRGEVVMPDGSIRHIKPFPHSAKRIEDKTKPA